MKWFLFFASVLLPGILVEVFVPSHIAFAANSSSVTTVTTVTSAQTLSQKDYRWYNNIDNLTPTSAAASEDTTVSTPSIGSVARLRMNIKASLQLSAGATFKLQYSNTTSSGWTDVATSTPWIFYDNLSVADGQTIATTVLSASTVGESYDESNPTAVTPNAISAGGVGEWDFVLANSSAGTGSDWFFRMISASGTVLDAYSFYPQFSAVSAATSSTGGGGGGGGGVSQGSGGGTGYYFGTSTGGLPVPPPLVPPRYQCEDFNGDNRVDIVDLSILLFYYEKSGPQIARFDCNNDGIIDFTDVSILMFYWTGVLRPRIPFYDEDAHEHDG